MLELLFSYGAGLLTLINPCVLPVLPIVLASAINADRRGPIALAAGMSISFVTLGIGLASVGPAIGLDADRMSMIGAVLMMCFGVIMLVPAFGQRFEMATAGMAAGADSQINTMKSDGLRGQFLGGLLLGAVWSPCIGPTLGGAIALASQGEDLLRATLIMIAFAAGVSTLIIGLGMGAQSMIRTRAQSLRGLAERSKPMIGAIFLGVGLMIFFKIHHVIEAWAVRNLPYWLQDLSLAL